MVTVVESSPGRIQGLVDSLAARLGRPVVLDDPDLRPIAHSPQAPEDADRVRTVSILNREAPPEAIAYLRAQGVGAGTDTLRIPRNATIGLEPRICQPVRDGEQTVGYVWVVDDEGSLHDGDVELVADVAEAMAALLSRASARLDDQRLRSRIHELLGGDPATSCDATAALLDSGAFAEHARVAALVGRVVPPAGERVDETLTVLLSRGLRACERSLPPRRHLTLARGDEGVALIGHDDPGKLEAQLPELAELLRDELLRTAPDDSWEVAVGIGETTTSLAGASRSYSQAAQAATVAARVPQMDPVLHWCDVGIYRLLVERCAPESDAQALPASLTRLLSHSGSEMLLHTLETYLDCAGDAQATTAELFLARGSLYYRLHRIEEIAEVNLRSGHDRLVLHLGLKLARIMGLHPAAPAAPAAVPFAESA